MNDLGTYEGLDIIGATVSVRNAGDGLSKSMEVDPVRLALHDTVHLVLECEVTKHTYEELKDAPDALRLVNVLKAGRATIVDAADVKAALDAQQARIEAASGVEKLPFDDEDGEDVEPLGDAFDEAIGAAEQAEADHPDEDGDPDGEEQ